MKKLLIIIAVFASSASFGQRTFWSFNYHMSAGVGSQSDYIQEASFRGAGVDGRGFIRNNLSVGGTFSWEVFHEIKRNLPPRALDLESNEVKGDITGVEYRYLNTLPIMVNGHFYLGSDGTVRPYFGVGVGASYIEQRTDIGLVSIVGKKWGFAVQPEIGVMIPFGFTGVGANVAGRFRYTTKTVSTDPVSFFTLAVGLGFMN